MEVMYSRCAGLDVHKKFLIACVMVPNEKGGIEQERKRFETLTENLNELADWLRSYRITHVVMESTGVYWKPVYNILHESFETWVVNARHLAQVPGRKTDETDAQWITKLMRYGLLEPSFIPNEWQRDLRDATRYRTRLIQTKSASVNRLHKILEDANIKLSSVVTDIQGVSARLMIEALINDSMDVPELAELAKGRLRNKIPLLAKALTGHVREHHRFMLEELLGHIDELNGRIATYSKRIAQIVEPYESIIQRLSEIPGVGRTTSEIILAEIGPSVDMWPTSAHLASWACVCPGNNESGGKRRSGKRQKGQKWLVPALVEAAWAASYAKDTYLAAQFQRLRARRGAKRAALAVAHSILTIVYHLLHNPDKPFNELGGDFFLQRNKEQAKRRALKTLKSLGYEVELSPCLTA